MSSVMGFLSGMRCKIAPFQPSEFADEYFTFLSINNATGINDNAHITALIAANTIGCKNRKLSTANKYHIPVINCVMAKVICIVICTKTGAGASVMGSNIHRFCLRAPNGHTTYNNCKKLISKPTLTHRFIF